MEKCTSQIQPFIDEVMPREEITDEESSLSKEIKIDEIVGEYIAV